MLSRCAQCGAVVEGRFCSECGTEVAAFGAPAMGETRPVARGGGSIARPGGSTYAAHVVTDNLLPGAPVTIDGDEVFVVLANGSVAGVLGPGRQKLQGAADVGVFVKMTPQQFRIAREISGLGGRGGSIDARAFGSITFVVQDPATFVGSLQDTTMIDGEALEGAVTESAGELIEQLVRAAMERGTPPDALDPSMLQRAAAQWPVPGTRVDFGGVSLSTSSPESEATVRSGDGDAMDRSGHIEQGRIEQGSTEEESTDLTSLIGEEVFVKLPNGRRAQGTVESCGYLVRLANGDAVWVDLEDVELE